MAEEEQSDQTSACDEEEATVTQASAVIEIGDSTTECEEETSPSVVQMEEKAFVSSLHTFMKDRGCAIERIPHLGFKQINLWMIYKTVEKLGGYDSVTARRLWKKVYDELGGSPGSTSAATCTRKHYEKLVLPFERHIKGEDDRPLPASKPRKPYKRNLDSKFQKAEKKRKRTQLDREMDSEIVMQGCPEAACPADAALRSLPALWAAPSDRHHTDCAQPSRAASSRCTSVYARLVQVPTSNPWNAHVPSAAGEVISPLEKKKRMAQASLSSPPGEEKGRPSVIHCSQSPAQASSSHACNSSDGSPVPLSPVSSRSPSPYSVSSEEGAAESGDQPARGPESPGPFSDSGENKSVRRQDSKPSSCAEISSKGKDNSQSADSSKDLRSHKMTNKCSPRPLHPHPSSSLKSDWAPASTSSFTKVIPKALQPYKSHPSRLVQQDDCLAWTPKLMAPWPFQVEKRDKSRTMLQKGPAAQHSLSHPPAAGRPHSSGLSSYEKGGRDSQQQSILVYPSILPNRMRLASAQHLYHHGPPGLAQSAVIGSALYPHTFAIPPLSPQMGYFSPAMPLIYPHNL